MLHGGLLKRALHHRFLGLARIGYYMGAAVSHYVGRGYEPIASKTLGGGGPQSESGARDKEESGVGNINGMRMLFGGLLAGLVLNIGEYLLNQIVLAEQWSGSRTESGMAEFGAGQMASGVIIMFLFGIALIWIYAAIRPRFGPGPKTAVIAGLTLWSVAWFLTGASFIVVGIFPTGQMVVSIIWGLFEVPIAAVAGARLYQESDAA